MRIVITSQLSSFIAARIANYAAEATLPCHRLEASDVAKFAALPLIRHWNETFGLRANGELVRWHTDGDNPYFGVRPIEELCDWLSALIEGSQRWPELAALLPSRSTTAISCWCLHYPSFAPGKVICPDCCGLGWVERHPLTLAC